MTFRNCWSRARNCASKSNDRGAGRLPALGIALAVALIGGGWLAAPARAAEESLRDGSYRFVFAVEGYPAEVRAVRSENAGSVAKRTDALWNSIDTRGARAPRPAPDGALAVAPTSEVSIAGLSHLARPASFVISAQKYGAASRLSLKQFGDRGGFGRANPTRPKLPGEGETTTAAFDPVEEKGPGDGGPEDRFWEATTTGISLNAQYREILGRDIDRSGFETYSNMVDNEGHSFAEIRQILLDSDEYRERILGLPPRPKTPEPTPPKPE